MNCPRCNNGLYTSRMRKDREGYPIYTLRCPEHGDIGEKGFKKEFRSAIVAPMLLCTWPELISTIVGYARVQPSGFDYLCRQVENANLVSYFKGVLETLSWNDSDPARGIRSHVDIGQCSGCDARFLYNHGYRVPAQEFPTLGGSTAIALMEGCIDAGI